MPEAFAAGGGFAIQGTGIDNMYVCVLVYPRICVLIYLDSHFH